MDQWRGLGGHEAGDEAPMYVYFISYPIIQVSWKSIILVILSYNGTIIQPIISLNTRILLYYNTIKECGKLSKVPILINTSCNIRGEPIVCFPEDAINCFLITDMDILAIGGFFIEKKAQKERVMRSRKRQKNQKLNR